MPAEVTNKADGCARRIVAVGLDTDPFDRRRVGAERGAVVGQHVDVLLEPRTGESRDVAQDPELCTNGEEAVVETALVAFAPAPQVGQKAPQWVVTHERVQKSPHAPLEQARLLRHSGICEVDGERAIVAAFAGQIGSGHRLIDAPTPTEDGRSVAIGRQMAPRDRDRRTALDRDRTIAIRPVMVAELVTKSSRSPSAARDGSIFASGARADRGIAAVKATSSRRRSVGTFGCILRGAPNTMEPKAAGRRIG
jgi:hypothetical protein